MSYNGSGTFTINSTGQPVVAGTVITASAFNALTADLATGLTTAITKDGQTTTTARIPFAQGINSSLVTDASSTSTGSIITAGGVGIAKALYVGTTANVAGEASISGLTVGKGGGAVSTNTAVGASALATNSTGPQVTALGSFAANASTGGFLVAVGASAARYTTTGASNVAVGNSALVTNTTGSQNTAIGETALNSNTTASNNTAVGYQAGYTNTTGTGLTTLGYQAGYTNSTGNYSTYIGGYAGNVATANGNTCVGYQSGLALSTGTSNTYIGTGSGYLMTTGSKNSILGGYNGNQGSLDIRTSSNYIVLSDGDGNPRGIFDSSGNLLVGATSVAVQNNNSIILNFSGGNVVQNHVSGTSSGSNYTIFGYNTSTIGSITQNGTTGVLYNLTSDYRLKNNPVALTGAKDFVMALQPKTWDWWDGSGKGVGFIAHEFMEVAKYSGHGEKDAVDEDGNPIHQSIQPSSSEVMANMVALMQEQQALITAQAETINALTARIVALESK